MKRIAAAIALTILTGSVAVANDRGGDRGHPHWTSEHRDSRDRHEDRRDRRDHRDFDRHDRDYRGGRFARSHWGEYHLPWGYRDSHWRRGDRLPRAYYARPYVLGNYGYYRLRSPPRGCHWVRVNHDVVLAAIATGIVLDVMYDYFG